MIHRSIESTVKDGFGYADLLGVGKDKDITCSLLLHLGVLTRSTTGNLRIANETAKTEVLERTSSYLQSDAFPAPLIKPPGDIIYGKDGDV
ncbi:hypothetical protein BC938DRAFT_478746 [Jimgerdemannia flammicorona]|uniref:Uncharacterized protein n=1 Tax=Jimgerdemannia flammicorona TaxID=994334 RepID=A0A433QY69_9FUNG|nr:hypothetical protein BC938DRAFT_478746 [Jimgerdemannia flammicorona]